MSRFCWLNWPIVTGKPCWPALLCCWTPSACCCTAAVCCCSCCCCWWTSCWCNWFCWSCCWFCCWFCCCCSCCWACCCCRCCCKCCCCTGAGLSLLPGVWNTRGCCPATLWVILTLFRPSSENISLNCAIYRWTDCREECLKVHVDPLVFPSW